MTRRDLPPSPTPLHYYTLLSVKERRFVDTYVTYLDPYVAQKAAGFQKVDAYVDLMRQTNIRCAIRERVQAVSELAGVTASELRRELKQINDADATELSGVHKVPCRFCHGMNNQFQYTDAEMRYIEQAYSYGEEKWPASCITNEFGHEIYRHATAAYVTGKSGRTLDIKGGDGYTRTREINKDCSQCCGDGTSLAYICDTRNLSDGGKKLLKGLRIGDNRFEVLTIDRNHIRDMLARDLQVGVEKKELVVTLPKTPEEFRRAIERMPVRDLEEFVSSMVTLGEDEYAEVEAAALPSPGKVGFRRGNGTL